MNIEENIRDRRAAQTLHETIGELLAEDVGKLPSDRSRMIFFQMLFDSAKKNLPPTPVVPPKRDRVPVEPKEHDEDVKESLEINVEIQELAEQVAWPDAPEVAENAVAIATTIEERNHCTVSQLEALQNMLRGMRAWVRG